jgi:hypothetical protein
MAAAAGGVTAIAAASGSSSTETNGIATAVDATDANTFAVLARPTGAGDAVPSVETQGLTSGSFTSYFGANLLLARRASGFANGGAWVVPGNSAVCLIADPAYANGVTDASLAGAAACASDSRAASGGLEFTAGSIRDAGVQTIAGLVPNGVDAVTVHLAGGSVISETVHDNVYMGTVVGDVSSVTYTYEGAAVSVDA